MVSCGGAAAIPGRQRSMGKISGFDVVEGSVRIYVRSMVGEPGTGLSGATTRTRYWSPSSAWHRDGWWACCVCVAIGTDGEEYLLLAAYSQGEADGKVLDWARVAPHELVGPVYWKP